jgi:predicted dehydrogenase
MNTPVNNSINRILIVGLGSIGKRHLKLARAMIPNADIRVLRHRYTNEIAEYSNGNFFSTEEVINFSPQIAVVANPATFHIQVAEILAEIGVHLLIEKPLSASIDKVSQLIATCKMKNLVLLTGYNLRFLNSLQYFKRCVQSGIIGNTLSVRCEVGQYLPSWRPGSNYEQGVSSQRELGGGALLELSHEIDYLRWIFGDFEWVSASLSKQSNLKIDVEDTVHMTIGFTPKVDGHQLIGVLSLDLVRQDAIRICTAIGEKGTLRWNGLNGSVSTFDTNEMKWHELLTLNESPDDSYRAEQYHFLKCVTDNNIPLITGEDGFKVLQIIEAARHSSLLQKRVVVNAMNDLGVIK